MFRTADETSAAAAGADWRGFDDREAREEQIAVDLVGASDGAGF